MGPFFVVAAEGRGGCMQKCMAALHNSTSMHRSDKCYLSIVHIGQGDRISAPHSKRNETMSIQLNRVLDVLASFAIVALGLALAGATAAVAGI